MKLRRHEEQHKAASACAGNFAADGTGIARGVVEFADGVVGNFFADRLFSQPTFVQQLAVFFDGPVTAEDGEGFLHHIAQDAKLAAFLFK